MSDYLLTINQLDHYYGQSHTLRDVTLDVPRASCTCIMGRNGVGKTTLARCLMGLEDTASGEIIIDGTAYQQLPAMARAPAGIGYVPQGRQIFPLLTVEENICTGFFGPAARKRSSKRSYSGRDIPSDIYQLFPVLKEMKNRRGGDLSGGQQQQLAIARAMIAEPELLILDEPGEGIQPSIVKEISDVVRMLCRDRGIGVLLIEQKLPFIKKVADSFYIMDRGSIVASGNIDELSEQMVQQHLVV